MKVSVLVAFSLIHGILGGHPIDQNCTQETLNLFNMLYSVARNPNKFLFGHHQGTETGVSGGKPPYKTINHKGFEAWQFTNTMVNSNDTDELSDVILVSGYYPAVVGFEFAQLDPDSLKIERYLSQRAHSRGMVLVMSWHFGNPATGGSVYDLHGHKIVRNLLPGGSLNKNYTIALDKIANYAHSLTDSKGRLIPFILRLFHEANGNWFWWGLDNGIGNTGQDIQAAHRYIVHYLRDIRGVHNILYAVCPNAGFANLTTNGTLPSYMSTYPGDEFVDILGYDDYTYVRRPELLQRFVDSLAEVVDYSESHDKIPALAEVGLNINNELDQIPDWWSDYILNSIKGVKYVKGNPSTKRVAYVSAWANNCWSPTNCIYFVPFKGHPGEKYFYNFTHDPMVVLLGKDDPGWPTG